MIEKIYPKSANIAFEAIESNQKVFGTVYEYQGVKLAHEPPMFCVKITPGRRIETVQPFYLLGKKLGYTFTWVNHDIEMRVFVNRRAFLAELQLAGRAFFLEKKTVTPLGGKKN